MAAELPLGFSSNLCAAASGERRAATGDDRLARMPLAALGCGESARWSLGGAVANCLIRKRAERRVSRLSARQTNTLVAQQQAVASRSLKEFRRRPAQLELDSKRAPKQSSKKVAKVSQPQPQAQA